MVVQELMAMVGGGKDGRRDGKRSLIGKPKDGIRKALPLRTRMKKAETMEVAIPETKEVRPEQVIPMDEAEFKDF